MAQDVADYLLERLRQWDVRHVFAYPGDGINGIVAAFGRADNKPQFIQARHEEMAAFASDGLRQIHRGSGGVHGDVRSGRHSPAQRPLRREARPRPGSRDRRPDRPQRDGRSLSTGSRLHSLFKDVASDYLVEVNVASQLPNALDRAIRTALTRRAPTALVIPSDLQEESYSAAGPRVQASAVERPQPTPTLSCCLKSLRSSRQRRFSMPVRKSRFSSGKVPGRRPRSCRKLPN